MIFLLLAGILLAWRLSKKVYKKYWCKNLTVETAFKENTLYEGEQSAIRETIVNDKLLPLPALEVRLALSKTLEFTGEAKANSNATDQNYKRDVFSLLFYQRIERTLPFTAHRRGCFSIDHADLTGYDFFFHSGYYRTVPQTSQLYVYPKQADTRRIALLCQTISGSILSHNRLHPDPFEFSGIREYQKTDPMNHINWKASARSTTLMVNQFDSTTSLDVTAFFDTEDKLILKYESLIEESIRIISSLAARFVQKKMDLTVKSNTLDADTGEPLNVFLPANVSRIALLNQKLACIDIEKTACPIRELLDGELETFPSAHTYVLVSKNQEDEILSSLHALAKAGNHVLWVIPILRADFDSRSIPERADPLVQVMYWTT